MFDTIVQATCLVLSALILIRSVLSWLPGFDTSENHFSQFLKTTTEPVLWPIRELLPRLGFIDMAPVVAIVLLVFVQFAVKRYA